MPKFAAFRQHEARLEFLLFNLALPICFFCFIRYCVPISSVFQFNPDEGLELAKVDLYQQGYRLYQDVWNDQPPLPTIAWTQWLRVGGHSVTQARLLTITFATALVWALSHCVRLTVGPRVALLSGLWLTVSFFFIQLSASVMMGLPALAMVMIAAYAVLLYRQTGQTRYLLGSALFFAVSVHLKLFTGFLAAAFIVFLFFQGHIKSSGQPLLARVPPVLVWLSTTVCSGLLIGLVLPLPSLSQLVESHLNASVGGSFNESQERLNFLAMFVRDPDFWAVTVMGGLIGRRYQRHLPLFPLLWLTFALITLLFHRPIWSHYYMLVSIPLVWLTAAGAQILLQHLRRQHLSYAQVLKQRSPVAIVLTLTIALIPVKLGITAAEIRSALLTSPKNFAVTAQIAQHRDQTRWLLTDVPMFAFRTGLLVPPEAAVFSDKRLRSGSLTLQQVTSVFQRYQPHQIVIGRFQQVRETLEPLLTPPHYRLVSTHAGTKLYLKQAQR
jgi:Dolichyl-phosphate-mannose-protein mannosyltransferase